MSVMFVPVHVPDAAMSYLVEFSPCHTGLMYTNSTQATRSFRLRERAVCSYRYVKAEAVL